MKRIRTAQNCQTTLKPVRRERIRSFRGIFKLKPGEKAVTEELIEEHAEELRREDEKMLGHGS